MRLSANRLVCYLFTFAKARAYVCVCVCVLFYCILYLLLLCGAAFCRCAIIVSVLLYIFLYCFHFIYLFCILYFVLFQFALRFVFVFSPLHMLHAVAAVGVVVWQICLIIFTLNVAPSKRECENNFKRETLLSQMCEAGRRGVEGVEAKADVTQALSPFDILGFKCQRDDKVEERDDEEEDETAMQLCDK